MNPLQQYLIAFHPFSTDELTRIEAAFAPKPYRKDEFLVQAGQVDRYVWFIESGVLRIYESVEDGTEQTFYFISAGQLAADPESFGRQSPAVVSMQVVSDCRARAISYDGFGQLADEIPAWAPTIQRITERALLEKVQKRSRLLYEDAKTRYVRLLVEQPDVVQQVPLGTIASYLGITLPSLSRLRRQLATQRT